MAFVSEIIPEEQKDKFTFPVETNRDGSKPTLYKWVIDRERNIFLVLTRHGGGPHQGVPLVEWYVLSLNNQIIRFELEPYHSGDFATGQHLLLKIKQLAIPQDLHVHKEEVIQLIQEVLTVYEWPYYKKAHIIKLVFTNSISFY